MTIILPNFRAKGMGIPLSNIAQLVTGLTIDVSNGLRQPYHPSGKADLKRMFRKL